MTSYQGLSKLLRHRWSSYSETFENMTSNLYLQYSFVFTFTNIFLTIRQEQTSLLNHCLSTQRRPHARPRAMPRAIFSFTNDNPFCYKQSIQLSEQSILLENNTILLPEQSILLQNNQSYYRPIVIRPDLLL